MDSHDLGSERPSDTEILLDQDQHVVKTTDLPKLRLFFELISLGGIRVERENSLVGFYGLLRAHKDYKSRALAMIQYMLEVIQVRISDKLNLDRKAVEDCESVLAFPSIVVTVCKALNTDDFEKLNNLLCRDFLRCEPGNIKSSEELFLKLFRMALISHRDVSFLTNLLGSRSILNNNLAETVMEYAQTFAFPSYLEHLFKKKLPKEKFDQLALLCSQHLGCGLEEVSSRKLLVSKLHTTEDVTLEDPSLIVQWLKDPKVNCTEVAKAVDNHTNKYKSSMDHGGQPNSTNQGGRPNLLNSTSTSPTDHVNPPGHTCTASWSIGLPLTVLTLLVLLLALLIISFPDDIASYIHGSTHLQLHPVEDVKDLHKMLHDVGNWEGLCGNLGVDQGTIKQLIHSDLDHVVKKSRCIQTYFDTGEANWEKVIEAVSDPPILNKRLAMDIKRKYF